MEQNIRTLATALLKSNLELDYTLCYTYSMHVSPATRANVAAVKELIRDLHLDNLRVRRWDFETIRVEVTEC